VTSTLTREIWLDDSTRMQPVGSTLTVLYAHDDPGRVRSLRDPNDPVPWGQWVLLGGILGLVAVILGVRGIAQNRNFRRQLTPARVGGRSPIAPEDPRWQPFLRGIDVPRGAPQVPADGGSAWDHPATRSQWNGYLLRSVQLAAAALGIACIPVPLEKLRIAAATIVLLELGAVGRAAWWRYLLASGPWQRWSAIQSTSRPGLAETPILLLTATVSGQARVEVTVRLSFCNRYALRDFTVAGGTVLFLPGKGRSGVLLLESGKRPFGTRLPGSRSEWLRWRTAEFEGEKANRVGW
jgi:hypothetical protein